MHGIKLVAFQQGYVQLFRPFRNCCQQIRHTHACSRSGDFRKVNVQHAAEPEVDEVFQLYQSRQPFVLRFSEQGRKFISRFRLGVNAGDVGHPFRLHLMQEINQGFNLSQKGSRIPPNGRAPFPEGGTDNDGLPEFLAAQQGQVGFINQVVKVPF